MTPASFLTVASDNHFPIQNLPFGVFSKRGGQRRVGVALGTSVIDLAALSQHGLFAGPHLQNAKCFEEVHTAPFASKFWLYLTQCLAAGHTEQVYESGQKCMDRSSRNNHTAIYTQ